MRTSLSGSADSDTSNSTRRSIRWRDTRQSPSQVHAVEIINWLLVNGGDAVQWLWGALCALFSALWHAFDWLANPVLSPLLSFLNTLFTTVGDAVFAVLDLLPVWLGLTILSVAAGLVMIIVFRHTSNQAAIGRVKDEIKANLLALKLYKDQLHVTFKAQARLFWAVVRLQRYMLTPLLIMLPPMVLVLAQMGVRYQWRPLQPGERTHVRLNLTDEATFGGLAVLKPGPGMTVEAGPVPGAQQVIWRIHAGRPGRHTLRFEVNGSTYTKELVVGQPGERVSAERPNGRWTAQILHPVERPLPRDAPLQSVEVLYPGVELWIHGANYWLLYFFVVSMLSAIVAGRWLGVRF